MAPKYSEQNLTESSLLLRQTFDESVCPNIFRENDRIFLALNTSIWWVESPQKFQRETLTDFPRFEHKHLMSRITPKNSERKIDRFSLLWTQTFDESNRPKMFRDKNDSIVLAFNKNFWWVKLPQTIQREKLTIFSFLLTQKVDESNRPKMFRKKHCWIFLASNTEIWWVESPQSAQREKLIGFALLLSQKFDESNCPKMFREMLTQCPYF